MATKTPVGAPVAKAARAKKGAKAHAAASAHACHCDMKPFHAAPHHGGWLNTALPGDKFTKKDPRRLQNPFTGGSYFRIAPSTPLLSGNGDGQIRGLIISRASNADPATPPRIKINWGHQKKMPPPSGGASTKPVTYCYAFAVRLAKGSSSVPDSGAPPPAYPVPLHLVSGWIPATSVLSTTPAKKKKLKALLACVGGCMARFDKQAQRKRFLRKRPAKPTHRIVRTESGAVYATLEKRFYTERHGGRGSDYISRAPDNVSPEGYVNLCYNLPDLKQEGLSIGGVACDTIAVGTAFYQISSVVNVKMCDIKDQYKYRQPFVFGAIRYIESKRPSGGAVYRYRYGWIALRALRRIQAP